MNVVGIIPARMASTRFPGKPLTPINGLPMLGHVYYRSRMCESLHEVYVATCDDVIKHYAESIDAKCIVTSHAHQRAIDRVAEAMIEIERDTQRRIDVVLAIQGDEPLLHPKMLHQCAQPLFSDTAAYKITNLANTITDLSELDDSNVVKVVVDMNNNALYFSRHPIPWHKTDPATVIALKQLGILGFVRDELLNYVSMVSSPLENYESVDMLRILEHGGNVHMVLTDYRSMGVDSPADLERASKLLEGDLLLPRYAHI